MTNLTDYLATLPGMADIRPVTVTIKGTTYEGASYRQTCSISPGCRAYDEGERESISEVIYIIGRLPKHYIRRSKVCYVIDGDSREWYVACHSPDSRLNPKVWCDNFKPGNFDPMFTIRPWVANCKIDYYSRKPYDRVALEWSFEL